MSENGHLLINNYELKEDIGEGNFGKVKLAIFRKTGEQFAIKIINKDKMKQKMQNILFKENEIITKFNHINVVYVFEILEEENNIYIVMEYCSKGELFDYIVSHRRLNEDEASVFFYQLINGVEYIHKKGVAHRDLKPENLLLTVDKTLKIIDFGLSHEYDENSLLKTKCGSPSYAAPEIIRGKLYDGFKTDIWCCGIILYAMLCGYLPFEGENNRELFCSILGCNPEYPPFLSQISKELIQGLLKVDPEERLTIEEIKNSDFYLKGKKLCKIDYKSVEDELEKRNTFYGEGKTKYKNFFKNNKNKISNNNNNEKKIEMEKGETLSIKPDNINNNNKKVNLIQLITDNNNDSLNAFRQQIMKKNFNFKKKVDLINDKIQKILQTDANEKNQNDLNNLKNINLFNYKNKNIENILGKQNIYEERFQNKNTGYFLCLKKNNINSLNSLENTASNSHHKTKKFFTQLVTPTPISKKYISPFLNDYSKNYLNKYKNTETINLEKHNNEFSLYNNANDLKTRTINKNNKEKSPVYENLLDNIKINKTKNDIQINKTRNKSVENKANNINYSDYKTNRNDSNDTNNFKYNNYNKVPKNKMNNIIANSVVNNINVIWENNSDIKNMNKKGKSASKNNYKNENYSQIKKMLNKYNKDINIKRNDYIGLKTENNNNEENINIENIKYSNKNLNTIDNIGNYGKENIYKHNKVVNYRSKSRDNGNDVIRNLKEKYINKNILPPLDIRMRLNN